MIDYQIFHEIKLLQKTHGMNTWQIAQTLNLSWVTVDKWLKAERFTPPLKKTQKRGSKLDPFKDEIQDMLRRYPYYSAIQIKQEISRHGYSGGVTILKEYLAEIRPAKTKAFLSLHFPPGENAQVDWGCAGYITINGKKRKVSYFVIVLSHSRLMHVTFTLSEAQEFWLDCHRQAFEYFGGVPEKVMVDNCKTAVLEHPAKGAVKLNPKYVDFANHYGFEIVACNVRQPQEKGRVENGVAYVRNNFINGRSLTPFEMLNIDVALWLDEISNQRIHGSTNRKPREVFEVEEKHLLQKLPSQPYSCYRHEEFKVSKLFRIRFDGNTYSVPPDFVGKTLLLQASCDKLRIYFRDSCVTEHQRCFSKGLDIEDPTHPRALIDQRKRADSSKSMEMFFKLGEHAQAYWQGLEKKTLHPLGEVRKILAFSSSYQIQIIDQAMGDAASHGAFNAAYVKNILTHKQRLIPEASPLHVPHKNDCLQLSIPEPDISNYR
jgi:transposase